MKVLVLVLGVLLSGNVFSCNSFYKLAEAGYFENRHNGFDGMASVMQVVINRKKDKRYSDDICGVVNAPSQFSYMNDGKPETISDGDAFHISKFLAYALLSEQITYAPVKDATVYYACSGPYKIDKPKFWNWDKLTHIATVADHCFYREV